MRDQFDTKALKKLGLDMPDCMVGDEVINEHLMYATVVLNPVKLFEDLKDLKEIASRFGGNTGYFLSASAADGTANDEAEAPSVEVIFNKSNYEDCVSAIKNRKYKPSDQLLLAFMQLVNEQVDSNPMLRKYPSPADSIS